MEQSFFPYIGKKDDKSSTFKITNKMLNFIYQLKKGKQKEENYMNYNRKSRINKKIWLLISLATAMVLWYLLSLNPQTARSFPNVIETFKSLKTMIDRGVFFTDLSSSLISVTVGFAIGFVLSLPVAILMAWCTCT